MMEAKEAIEILNGEGLEDSILTNEDINQMTKLLQQGEKYRQMWEELDDFIGYSDYDILQKMKELKQKYFPKGEQ